MENREDSSKTLTVLKPAGEKDKVQVETLNEIILLAIQHEQSYRSLWLEMGGDCDKRVFQRNKDTYETGVTLKPKTSVRAET